MREKQLMICVGLLLVLVAVDFCYSSPLTRQRREDDDDDDDDHNDDGYRRSAVGHRDDDSDEDGIETVKRLLEDLQEKQKRKFGRGKGRGFRQMPDSGFGIRSWDD